MVNPKLLLLDEPLAALDRPLDDDGVSRPAVATKKEAVDRTDDPVRMYLREMGAVELLSREGEIAIAKRIEAGRDTMIMGLCESPITFHAIIMWSEALNNGEMQLREILDLDAMLSKEPPVEKMEEEAKLDAALIKQCFELGLMGIETPEEFGGAGAAQGLRATPP